MNYNNRNDWGESKQKTTLTLTPTVRGRLQYIADQLRVSQSEVIERIIRRQKLDSLDDLLDIKGLK